MIQNLNAGVAAVALICLLIRCGSCSIPDYIQVCKRKDPDLAGCIRNSVEALRPKLKSGIADLEVPSVEPFHLNALSFSTSSQGTHLLTNLTNIVVYGASDFRIIRIIPTLKKIRHTFQFEVLLSHLYIEGNYEVNSRILLLSLKGNGPFKANISNYHFDCTMVGNKINRKGDNHLLFDKMTCDVVIGKTSIQLENLFNGSPVLGKATNDVINDNVDLFFDEIRPNLVDSLSELFTSIANKITLHFKYEDLFP